MKTLLVPWWLLLFGVSLNSGHYIRDTEEPAVTERSFTNSHGFQFSDFLKPEPLSNEYDEKEELELDEHEDLEHTEDENHEAVALNDEDENEEEVPETTTETRPLTNEEIKEAYKLRSYLFDQSRQRYGMAVPDSLHRRKRQADTQSVPEAPQLYGREAYVQPKTYGMNLNPEGGYVWNNLNKPGTFYELGPSNGNPNQGEYASGQSQESTPPSENTYIPPPTSNSGSSEDIYVNTNRPSAMPSDTEPIANPELVNENPELLNENPEPNYENPEATHPVEPATAPNDEESSEGFANSPIGPEVYENPKPSDPVEPIFENPSYPSEQEPAVPLPETPISESPAEPAGESIDPGYDYGQASEEPRTESQPEKSSEGDQIKEIPEAPTLPPLNYDNLPDYIREAISSTEKPTSDEQTDIPYINPQTNADDKKVMEDKMEDIFATVTPVEDIPKTYGMNLSSDGGHVWNDMVNPPVSYDVGTPNKPEEEHKEEETQPPIIEQPELEYPVPNEPEIEEPVSNPEEPHQEPEINESEEPNNPVEEPSGPVNEESEESIAPNPEIPESNNEPEPELPVTGDNTPIEKPAEPAEPEPAVVQEIPQPENEDNYGIEVTEQPGDVEKPTNENEEQEPTETNPEKENEKPDIMSELLKSEQFWKWLGEWTATYMELLEKHIRKIAIQEICNREKSGEQMCLLGDKTEDTGVAVKDGKIIVDGREIEMTHTDNIDSGLKKGHHYNRPDNKGNEVNKIEASTIYGNSVGNDKVTNVFIFTADKADEVIDKLKPANETEVDFVIDDRIKEEDKELNQEKSIEETGAEEPNEGNKEDLNGSETDTEELNKEDSDKSELDETTKEEETEKPDEAVDKEDFDVSEPETEELNKEDEKASSQEANKESNDEELSESTPIDADSQNKKPSGDADEPDDADEESKMESSEKNINSKEYLEK